MQIDICHDALFYKWSDWFPCPSYLKISAIQKCQSCQFCKKQENSNIPFTCFMWLNYLYPISNNYPERTSEKRTQSFIFHTQQFSQIQMGNGGVHDGRCRSCGRKEELYHHCSQGENADKQTTKRTEDLHENVHVHWCHKKHGQTDEKAQVILFLSDFMVNSDVCNNSSEPLLNTTTGSRGSNLWWFFAENCMIIKKMNGEEGIGLKHP